jgi:hypothetical protein
MPDFDHDPVEGPLQALHDLAAAGHVRARGLSAAQVRALGTRRHRRRMAAGLAATSAAVVVFVGGAFAAAGQLTSTAPVEPAGTGGVTLAPSPPATAPSVPSATPTRPQAAPTGSSDRVGPPNENTPADGRAGTGAPAGPGREGPRSDAGPQAGTGPGEGTRHAPRPGTAPTLTRSVLLQAGETWYHQGGDFAVSRTVHGGGDDPVSVCQHGSLATLGAVDRWRRDFVFRDGGGPVLRTAALQFADADAASAAYRTLGFWASQCEATVRSRGYTTFADNGRWYQVDTGDGLASFRSGMSYGPVEGDTTGEMAYFDDLGVVLTRRRVMLLSLVVPGQDHNWTYSEQDSEQTGLSLHPMFHLLPAAARALAD